MAVWLLRIVWSSLPITAGSAAADALTEWSTTSQLTAAALLWTAWATVLVGLFAPRPAGLTALRVAAPTFFALAVVVSVAGDVPATTAVGAVLATAAALVLAGLPEIAAAAANGVAYGDERRFPLKVPPALFLGPLPLAPLLVAAGIATGPQLLAAGHWFAGVIAIAAGLPLAGFLGRALHGLSRRWAVLVPAGLVLADPLTLPDPVLFLRERIMTLRPIDPGRPLPPGALDVRLGALRGSLVLTLNRETELLSTRRGRRGWEAARPTQLAFSTVRSRDLLAEAAARRVPVLDR